MPTKKKTYHEGANDERTAFLAYFRRMIQEYPDTAVGMTAKRVQSRNIAWALQRNERYNAKQGGLGKK